MAAANLIADGTGLANSVDVVVASTLAVSLKDYASDAIVYVFLKDDAGSYQQIGALTSSRPSTSITAPGTYRLTRPASSGSCGVFSG